MTTTPQPATTRWAVTDGGYDTLATFDREEDAHAAVAAGFGADVVTIAHYPAGTLPQQVTVHRWRCGNSTDPRLESGVAGYADQRWNDPTDPFPACRVSKLGRPGVLATDHGLSLSAHGTDPVAVRAAVEYAYEQLTARWPRACDCESYEPCYGACCGVGNCSCSACTVCNRPLIFRRTPALPAPAGIWQHVDQPDDDHEVGLPWAPTTPEE